MKAAASARAGRAKKRSTGGALDQPSAAQEKNLVREPPRLTEIVCRHDDLGSTRMDLADDRFDLARGGGVEIRGGLVEEEDFGAERPRTREREFLLFSSGEKTRRLLRARFEPDRFDHVARAQCPLSARNARDGSPYSTLASAERRSITGR